MVHAYIFIKAQKTMLIGARKYERMHENRIVQRRPEGWEQEEDAERNQTEKEECLLFRVSKNTGKGRKDQEMEGDSIPN